MPTYDFYCSLCDNHIELFLKTLLKEPQFCLECNTEMDVGVGGGSGVIFEGKSWPGKSIKRQDEDQKIKSVVHRAKQMKETGKVSATEHLTSKDVNRHNPE